MKTAASPIRERSISFNHDILKLIESGRKTQMRRTITTLQGYRSLTEFKVSKTPGYHFTFRREDQCWCDFRLNELLKMAPYGQKGDLLHIRNSIAFRALELIDVRVERLQAISEQECMAEGVHPVISGREKTSNLAVMSYLEGFKCYWNMLNRPQGRGWDTNPWVFVYEFRVLKGIQV